MTVVTSTDYREVLARLLAVNMRGGMKLGLDNMLQLDALLGKPSNAFPSIHVAGTNGKGSVCTKIATALQRSGYRVGLYTSPHVSCFRERIRVDGMMVPEDFVADQLRELFLLTEEENIPATFFELTTLLAFRYFATRQVDVAVVEVGLGGRLDATNILTPVLSVITSISKDHTELLGTTEDEIAREKAGIIKPGVPVVVGPRVPQGVVRDIARGRGSRCLEVEGAYSPYDQENHAVAAACIGELQAMFPMDLDHVAEALTVRPSSRCEVMRCGRVPVVLDVAHNPDGLRCLFEAVEELFPEMGYQVVVGLSANKDVTSCMEILDAKARQLHLVAARNGRGVPSDALAAQTRACHHVYGDISEAVHAAIDIASAQNHVVVVCGTFFIMGEARRALGIADACDDEFDLNERR